MRGDLELFDRLVNSETDKRERRSLELLRNPTGDCPPEWAVYLPAAFNAALDIAQTPRIVTANGVRRTTWEWTQGSAFAFSPGDILYDTRDAYECWSKALTKMRFCFQVERAASAAPRQKDSPRYPGSVALKISCPDAAKKGLVFVGNAVLSQDEFVRFVLCGESETLNRMLERDG